MVQWKEISIKDYKEYNTFFINKIGLVHNLDYKLNLFASPNKSYDNYYINKDDKGNKTKSLVFKVTKKLDLNSIFNNEYFINNSSINQNKDIININDATKINNPTFNLKIYCKTYSISKLDDLDNIKIMATKDYVDELYHVPYNNLKEGEQYYSLKNGEFELVELFDSPDDDECICDTLFEYDQDLRLKASDIYYLPYKYDYEYENKYDLLNETIKELYLEPYCSKDGNLVNIMWKQVDNASRYIVKLYKIVNSEVESKLYFLKDYIIPKNEYILSLNDIVLDNSALVIIAQDYSEKILAKSRGINLGLPNPTVQHWESK